MCWIIGITTYGDSRTVTGQFEVRYTTVENPNGGESVDFGTIVQSTNEEQNGLSYTRYYFDAEGVMVSSILYTPYVGEAALSRSMATIRDYAPDGQLLRMEGLMYMDGELVYHTLEEYTTLWDALN